jgi:hypothetical protein
MSAPRDIQAVAPHGSVLFPTVYSIYINDMPRTPGVYLGLFANDTNIYTTDCREGYVFRRMQQGFSATEARCEHWNIKVNNHKTQVIYFSHIFRSPEAHLLSNEWNIPFVNHVKYFCVIFDKRFT